MISFRKLSLILAGLSVLVLSPSLFASTKSELQAIQPQVQQIAAQSDIMSAVTAANQAHANLTKTDIRNLGRQWHDGLSGKSSDVLNQVNSSALSASLKTIQAQNASFTGILVTDNKGLVIGQTYNADHYSQARKTIWNKIAKDGVNATYYGKAKQNNGVSLATIGLPIVQNNQVIGAILVETKVTASAPAKKDTHHSHHISNS